MPDEHKTAPEESAPEETTNPAKRLFDILEEARKQGPDLALGAVWEKVLSISPTRPDELFGALSQLQALVGEVEGAVRESTGGHAELLLRQFHVIRFVLSLRNLDSLWRDYRAHLDNAVMLGLEMCAARLAETHSEKAIPGDQMREIAEKIQAVIEEILASTLSKDTKRGLIRILEAALRAIVEYRIDGPRVMKAAVTRAVGELALLYPTQQDKENPLLKTVGTLIEQCAKVVQLWEKIQQLATYIPALSFSNLSLPPST